MTCQYAYCPNGLYSLSLGVEGVQDPEAEVPGTREKTRLVYTWSRCERIYSKKVSDWGGHNLVRQLRNQGEDAWSSEFLIPQCPTGAVSIILQTPTAELMIAFPATDSNAAAWPFLHLCACNTPLIVTEHLLVPGLASNASRGGKGMGNMLCASPSAPRAGMKIWMELSESEKVKTFSRQGGITGFLHFSHFYRK